MLNYIWISLVVIGILVAAGTDFDAEMKNTYRNDVVMEGRLTITKSPTPIRATIEGVLILDRSYFNDFYGVKTSGEEIRLPVVIQGDMEIPRMAFGLSPDMPVIWKEFVKYASTKDKLSATVHSLEISEDGGTAQITFVREPIRFVKFKGVTQAALDYASIAVNIAIGLIGIMALWLGVMKVAEAAGLIRSLTRLLTPLTKRLFPDVPPDHPAVGAMIMNIAANMLGLSNAATPLGLKAMEELNKLNPKIGTATNAMCTFLVINTAGLVLLPATAIAVRAVAGSANPGIIIGTSIFGAGCATIAGLIAVKLLEKLKYYKKDLIVKAGGEGGPKS